LGLDVFGMRWIMPFLVGTCCGLVGVLSPWLNADEDKTVDPPLPISANAPDALTLAAEALDRGDQAEATKQMHEFVRTNPSALMPRAHLAELFFRQGRAEEARRHYEQFISDAQLTTGPTHRHLVHCHTRLMQLAEDRDDEFHEALHRGIGLTLIPEPDEPTLAKALASLLEANRERPTSARVQVYLARVYLALNQTHLAKQSRERARTFLPDPSLTLHEHRELFRDPGATR
jgi:Tfp pilus assembly protein PilF